SRWWPLPEIDRLRRASGAALVAELHDRLGALFARSYARRAPRFAAEELEDPRALRAGQQALAGLHALALADPRLDLDHARVRAPRGDRLERERHLFYICCSRAERTLVLSSRFADEQGAPQVESFLLDEVRDLFAPAPARTRRSLSDVTWPLGSAPTEAEW